MNPMDPCDTSTDLNRTYKSLEGESGMDTSQPAISPHNLAQFLMPYEMWARRTNGWAPDIQMDSHGNIDFQLSQQL